MNKTLMRMLKENRCKVDDLNGINDIYNIYVKDGFLHYSLSQEEYLFLFDLLVSIKLSQRITLIVYSNEDGILRLEDVKVDDIFKVMSDYRLQSIIVEEIKVENSKLIVESVDVGV